MTAIRLTFYSLAIGFVLLAAHQGWLAAALLSEARDGGARAWIALAAALACLAAAVATVLSARRIRSVDGDGNGNGNGNGGA